MDLFPLIILILAIVIISSLCGACCRMRKPSLAYTTATVVTTVPASNTVPNVVPYPVPYPIQQNVMPVPAQGGPLNIGIIGYPYPTNPQPGHMPGQVNPPYPQPVPVSAMAQQNPPSYAEATGVYAKQSPYNPQYP